MSQPNTDALFDAKKQLYNRQEYVIGAETQARYGCTDVLVVGACGLGGEIVKNLCLTGLRRLFILDPTIIQAPDLGSNFFLTEADVGLQRGNVVAERARELNRFVEVHAVSGTVADHLDKVNVVVFANQSTTRLIEDNELARKYNVKFVSCESRGVTGCIFVDGGDSFEILDADGEETVSCVVTGFTQDGLVTLHEDKKHECEVGSRVYFTGIVSPTSLNSVVSNGTSEEKTDSMRLFEVSEVVTPFILRIKGINGSELNGKPVNIGTSSYLHTTKKRTVINFKKLSESIQSPEFTRIIDCEEKALAPETLHALFCALHAKGAPPTTPQDVESLAAEVKNRFKDTDKDLVKELLSSISGEIQPMTCFIGGMASQEVLKVCSGKFTPIYQWMYFDAREILTARGPLLDADDVMANKNDREARYDGQIRVLGRAFQRFISQQRAFIVGAGALGCELIKNVSLMGFAGASITDMDSIEMSNLSRQFLFRTHHLGRSKSEVAAEAAKLINPLTDIVAFQEKVGPETEGVFNEKFWSKHSFVLNALDNVSSRKYVDSRCLFYQKPLFESGTLGTKCNLQCVIPFVTESYSNSYDPPEKSIPLCTLKNFPNAIEHTIQWARDQFHALFSNLPKDVNAYLSDPSGFEKSLENDPASKTVVLQSVQVALSRWPKDERDCARIARLVYHENFNESFLQLLYNLPLDKRTETGELFWSGAKKPPTPQVFDPNNKADADFVYHCACMFHTVYCGSATAFTLKKEEVIQLAANVSVPDFVPRKTHFAISEADKKEQGSMSASSEISVKDLPPASLFSGRRMHPVEFEKDDPTNHHIDFITHCSNLRAIAYKIPPADVNHTKRIAGNIIPAMVTTTALVTGLVGLEVLKYTLLRYRNNSQSSSPSQKEVNALLSIYRNAFVNISLPFVAFSDPIAVQGDIYPLPDGSEVRWSVWDHIDLNEGKDISVDELVNILKERYGFEIFMIALASGKMLFSQFGVKKKDGSRAVSVVAKEKGEEEKEGNDYLNLVTHATIDDEDVNVPIIRYKYRNF